MNKEMKSSQACVPSGNPEQPDSQLSDRGHCQHAMHGLPGKVASGTTAIAG